MKQEKPLLRLILPFPISTNRIWIYSKRGVYLNPKYRSWKKEAGWLVNKQVLESRVRVPIRQRVIVVLTLCDKRGGDADNYGKSINDLLTGLGVLPDDAKEFISETRQRWSSEIDEGCMVEIYAEGAI